MGFNHICNDERASAISHCRSPGRKRLKLRFAMMAALAGLSAQPVMALPVIEHLFVDYDSPGAVPYFSVLSGGYSIEPGGPTGNYLQIQPYDPLHTIRIDGDYTTTLLPNGKEAQVITSIDAFDVFFENDGYYVTSTKTKNFVAGGSWFSVFPNTNAGDVIFRSAGGVRLDNIALTRITEAIPEPSTWAMFILGFGLIGGVMRRRMHHSLRYESA